MPEYNVHLYATIRRKFTKIKARSHKEAIKKVAKSKEYAAWRQLMQAQEDAHIGCDAEDINHAVVDVVGDELYFHTRDFHLDGDPEHGQIDPVNP